MDLVAVQAYVRLRDYLTESAFERRTRSLFDKVRAARGDGPALVVFPEMYGAFLGLLDQGDRIRGCTTTDQAMTRVALSGLVGVLGAMARGRTASLKRGLFLSLAPRLHRLYYETFSSLAAEHQVWVVAGSLLLPWNEAGLDTPEMSPRGSAVYNTSYTFDPRGRCVSVTRKVNLVPTQEDVLDLSAGSADDVPVVDTPCGRVATAICYDGFREAHTSGEPGFVPLMQRLDARGVDVVACPSANPWPWDEPWVFNQPGEGLARREQWMCEGMAGSMARLSHVRYGVNPMLIGRILDHPFDGRSHIYARRDDGTVDVIAQAARADIDPGAEEIVVARVQL